MLLLTVHLPRGAQAFPGILILRSAPGSEPLRITVSAGTNSVSLFLLMTSNGASCFASHVAIDYFQVLVLVFYKPHFPLQYNNHTQIFPVSSVQENVLQKIPRAQAVQFGFFLS